MGPACLAACGGDDERRVGRRAGAYPLARPDNPVTLPIFDDNPADRRRPGAETGGVFKVLNYADYMAPGVMKDFEREVRRRGRR